MVDSPTPIACRQQVPRAGDPTPVEAVCTLPVMNTRGFSRVAKWTSMLVLAGGLALGGCEESTTDDDIMPISMGEIQQQRGEGRGAGLVFIDARNARQFADLHIAGARNMQFSEVPLKNAEIDPALAAAPLVVVYGDDPGSNAARALTKRMIKAGYENVVMYMGGLSEWVRAGGPVEGAKAGR